MALTLKDLKNIRQLRAILRPCSADEIADILEKIKQIYKDKKEEEARLQAALQARERSINNALNFLEQEDLNIYDLIAAVNHKNYKKRGKMAPKYAYTGVDGVNYTWTGQGKTPSSLLKLMERDQSHLEDYLINKEPSQFPD